MDVAVRNRREVIDRARLGEALDALAHELGAASPELGGAVLALLKQTLEDGRNEIRGRFESGEARGLPTARAQCYLMDQLIRALFDFTTRHVYPVTNPTMAERLGLVAVGGYGRGELAPQSDIDLLFLLPYKETAWSEQVVEYMLYMLWDLGLKVGHATRSVQECLARSRSDLTIRTAILEARYLWGDLDLFLALRDRFHKEIVSQTGPEFVDAKLKARDERHKRMGDTRYVVEPNIKEGKGGLRDLHTLFWIAKFLYRVDQTPDLVQKGVFTQAEFRRFQKAEAFLWDVRCHLHYLTGRAEERLTFDVQLEMARRLGYADRPGSSGVERFMKHYFLVAKDVGDLTRILCAALEETHKRKSLFNLPRITRRWRKLDGFVTDGARVNVVDEKAFSRDPVDMIRLFQVAQRHGLDIHPRALHLITRNLKLVTRKLRDDPEANRLFLEILTSKKDPETSLKRLNEAGVFGRFIPDFGRVVAQMQHDMYHHYTVDEHTIRAIGVLSRIEAGALADEHPLSSEILPQILSRRVLYVALLLHDIAKGRGGDHSILGAEVALALCPRLGFSESETETISWLVRHHLLMSNTAFKRDLADPKTILDFAAQVQSLERLRLLLVLTVADIRAVGPGVWNGWKGQLLRELYYLAEEALTGGFATKGRERRIAEAKDVLAGRLSEWKAAEIAHHFGRHYENYWLSADLDQQTRHARLMREADAEKTRDRLTLDWRTDPFKAVTELTLYAPDHPGLFARVTGALAVTGASIVDAKIFTTTDGMALDMFWIQNDAGEAYAGRDRIARLEAAIRQTLAGELVPRQALANRKELPRRTHVFKVAPQVLIDNNASNRFTVLEVTARDRRGLVHDIARALLKLNLTISSAHITTYGERAVDSFYVTDLFGQKVTHGGRKKAIERHLIEAMSPLDETDDTDETTRAGGARKGEGDAASKSAVKRQAKAAAPA